MSNKIYTFTILNLVYVMFANAQSLISREFNDLVGTPAGYYGAEIVNDGDTLKAVFIKFATSDKLTIRSISSDLGIDVNSISQSGIASSFLTKQQLNAIKTNENISLI